MCDAYALSGAKSRLVRGSSSGLQAKPAKPKPNAKGTQANDKSAQTTTTTEAAATATAKDEL